MTNNLPPAKRYQHDLQQEGFEFDPAQKQVVEALQKLYEQLSSGNKDELSVQKKTKKWTLFAQKQTDIAPEKGLYIWGGVGRGKTYLVDCFYEALPFKEKRRRHFHRFMQDVHDELRALGQQQNPLPIIAKKIALDARVICFDEFFVSDITDAMLLGGLFEALFANGVTLVATSNIPPKNLYLNGLQRERFLPAIAQIEQHTKVINLDSDTDYRLRVLTQAEIYHAPLDRAANENLAEYFEKICPDVGEKNAILDINHRQLATQWLGDGIVWFNYETLCDSPRSQADYVELARCFHTLILADVPIMTADEENQARRFIALVDEFYDRRVKLIISAAADMEAIYTGKRLQFEFQRTLSRLQEMQSTEYLAEAHRP